VSELTNRRELRALQDSEALNGRAMYRSGFSLFPYPDQGEGSFSELVNFPEVPGVGGLECMPDVDGGDGAARAPYVRSAPKYGILSDDLGSQLELHNLEIA